MTEETNSMEDPLVAEYYSLKPCDFRDVEQFTLRQTVQSGSYVAFVDIILRPIDPESSQQLHLSFSGVLNLRLTPPIRMVIQIVTLEISTIKDRQWEGINYSVKETEHETLSFLCRDFTAKIREGIDQPPIDF